MLEEALGLVETLRAKLANAFAPSLPEGGFLLTEDGARERALDYMLGGDFADATSEILSLNPELSEYLEERTTNAYRPLSGSITAELYADRRDVRLNYAAGMIARNRNRNFLPKHQLLLACEAEHKMMNRVMWQHLSSVCVLPSHEWLDGFLDDALGREGALLCPYPILDYVSACVFDNYTEHFNYSARHNAADQGERIDMTNWASVYLPQATSPYNNLRSLAAGGTDPLQSMFRPHFDKFSVVDLCHPLHPDIVANQHRRWCYSFRAVRNGTLFERPSYHPPVAHHLHYQRPFEGLLQSSYEHVEAEMDGMRTDPKHRHSWFVFVGGDGLAINRVNHTIARDYTKYLQNKPAVIPVQGEHPHGTCHICHMGWRPYAPLLVPLLQAIGHAECKADFTVSNFNDYDHAMCILIEGVAQYFLFLSSQGGAPPLTDSGSFLAACSVNIDLDWLAHFLHDFGFLYWDVRQSVRGNESERIDLSWRECVAFMHTRESNKTQYAPMAILRVFWSQALHPFLAEIYHKNRTISLLGLDGSNVGWDMPIEKENLAISNHVVRPTFERICTYVTRLNILGPVSRGIERVLLQHRNRQPGRMKKVNNDVQALVEHLKKTLGHTWVQACTPRAHKESLLVNPPRSPKPWESILKAVKDGSFSGWVRHHIATKVTWM